MTTTISENPKQQKQQQQQQHKQKQKPSISSLVLSYLLRGASPRPPNLP